jgi:hypothetical protein
MAQNTRTELKNKFKRGMYPNEGDFSNVFDSYVHKDDMVELEKVVQTIGNEQKTLSTIINETKEEAIAAAVQQADESEKLTAIRNRLTTAEDNIAGHETRIQTLETSKSDYEEFKERVRAFLEDADNSDETINRWHEIENFLQGITDTETLTGLLNDFKQEILNEIPEPQTTGNFIEYSTDLDAEADAPNGKIMQYWGQTNDKYQRGHFYERVEKTLPADKLAITLNGQIETTPSISIQDRNFIKTDETIQGFLYAGHHIISKNSTPSVGDIVILPYDRALSKIIRIKNPDSETPSLILDNGDQLYSTQPAISERFTIYQNTENLSLVTFNWYQEEFYMENPQEEEDDVLIVDDTNYYYVKPGSIRIGSTNGLSSASWQHLHIDNVIS